MWYSLHYLVGGFNHLEKYYCNQWEGLSHILWTIKNVWNHQPFVIGCYTLETTNQPLFVLFYIGKHIANNIVHLPNSPMCLSTCNCRSFHLNNIRKWFDMTWYVSWSQNMGHPSYNGNTRSSYHDISSYLILNCESHILYYKWYDFTCFTLS